MVLDALERCKARVWSALGAQVARKKPTEIRTVNDCVGHKIQYGDSLRMTGLEQLRASCGRCLYLTTNGCKLFRNIPPRNG